MPRFSARPDELTAAGAGADGDADTLHAVARSVLAAGRSATDAGAGGGSAAVVAAAAAAYTGVDAVVASALGEAVTLLGRALAEAATAYAAAEEAVGSGWGTGWGAGWNAGWDTGTGPGWVSGAGP